jgi:hypothetical protein
MESKVSAGTGAATTTTGALGVAAGGVVKLPPESAGRVSGTEADAAAGAAAGAAGAFTLMVKMSEALEVPSLALTLMSIETKPTGGVPLKAPVAGLKVSQAGSGEPPTCVALNVSGSSSVNVPGGSV